VCPEVGVSEQLKAGGASYVAHSDGEAPALLNSTDEAHAQRPRNDPSSQSDAAISREALATLSDLTTDVPNHPHR
jgi:hypothetical protein